MAVWAFAMSRGRNIIEWRPNLPVNALKLLCVIVVLLNLSVLFGHDPDDAGVYTNLGAQRWVATGTMPYADALLKGADSPAHGAAATYGPLLYLAHIPFQLLTGTVYNPADVGPKDAGYIDPPYLATQLTCMVFQLVALWALYGIGRRSGGQQLGLSLVILYAGSAYVLGLGSNFFLAGGLAYISHIAPTAMLLLAIYYIDRPFVAGMSVAAAAGVLFFPVFFFPLFAGWYFWRSKAEAARFVSGFALVGLLIGLMVITYTGSLDGKGPIRLLLESTLEHQEGFSGDQYGMSPFSFWGNFPALAAIFQEPIIGTTSIFKPTFILFISWCVAAFFLARKRTGAELALLLASLAAALQLWKTHAAGTYVEWYYPFLLYGLLGRSKYWDQVRQR
jgi:MFS family permease